MEYIKPLLNGARTVVEICANVQANEQVLIITEDRMIRIAQALAAAVKLRKAEPIISIITPRQGDGAEPPSSIAEALQHVDVFFSAVYTSITHTRAVKNAVDHGVRGILLTQFSEEMLEQGGITANFSELAPRCKSVAKMLENSAQVHLTTRKGTDLRFSAEGRRGNALTCIVSRGQFSTVPTIEANVSPIEGTATGKLVIDGSIPYAGIGLLTEPVIVNVSKGYITTIYGGNQAQQLAQILAEQKDREVYNIAELGIGLNPCCHFCGVMLEDEGVEGSVHIGIGTNITLGGNVQAKLHYDLIMKDATLEVNGQYILQDGKVTIAKESFSGK